MNILKSAALLAAGLIALAGCQKGAVDTKADEAAIRAGTTAWATAYNNGDGEAMAANYAEDAVLLPPNAPAVTGRAAIREFLETDSQNTRGAGLKFNIPGDGPVQVSRRPRLRVRVGQRRRCVGRDGRDRQVHRRLQQDRRQVVAGARYLEHGRAARTGCSRRGARRRGTGHLIEGERHSKGDAPRFPESLRKSGSVPF